jgi:hypothetical protein
VAGSFAAVVLATVALGRLRKRHAVLNVEFDEE